MIFQLLALVAIGFATSASGAPPSPLSVRVAVVKNTASPTPTHMAFTFNSGGLVMATSDDAGDTWTGWTSQMVIQAPPVANPVAISSYVASAKKHLVHVFAQLTSGMIATLIQSPSDPAHFIAKNLTVNVPANLSDQSTDPLQAVTLNNRTFLFVRIQKVVYWTTFTDLTKTTPKFQLLGDSGADLAFDPCAAVNTFLGRIEVFGVANSGDVIHTWQDGPTSFHGSWKHLGGPFSPKFASTPVVHQMGHSDYNGVLNLFVKGQDNYMHHISQTTCDKVNNLWGPCTWGVFHSLGGEPPYDLKMTKPLIATHSIHLGIEVFTVGKKDGHLYHLWQKERDSSYSDWEDLGPLTGSSPFASTPAILFDDFGWWEAYALNSSNSLKRFLEQPLKFSLSPGQVDYSKNVTVTWAIPEDQATHIDWLAVYPVGVADGHRYIDFMYVGGNQNPYNHPVPQGHVQFMSYLPNGTYDYRYMVNKAYTAVFNNSVTVVGSPAKEEWVAMFDGISLGLGGFNTNVTACAHDGEHTVATFQAAFDAFEDRKIYEGLHLFAEGLSDFRDALVQCNETDIIKILVKFIEDLVACTADSCAHFLIDLGLELLILYEHVYEIYGDILAASNSFHFNTYEQGGICIGRVTWSCLQLE